MRPKNTIPPKLAQRLLLHFLRDDLAEEVLGDLEEKFNATVKSKSLLWARVNYWYQTLNYLRPFAMRRSSSHHSNHYAMFQSYFKISWRNLTKNIGHSSINIGGLAMGMGVVILIGLWVHDELLHDRYHKNYDKLARVVVNQNFNGQISTQWAQPFPLGEKLRSEFSDDFEYVSMASWSYGHFLEHEKTKISKEGMFAEPQFVEMTSLKMLKGNKDALRDPRSIILNTSVAKAIFGDEDPVGKIMRIDNHSTVTVTGVFEDIPNNSSFSSVQFLLPWDLLATDYDWANAARGNWGNFSFQTFVQLKPSADIAQVSSRISDVITRSNPRADSKPELLLHPMAKWHLYGEFQNGINTGGDIQFVWLFGIIGGFVLLLACINFVNLSTARSEKRAKEVGVRKTIGSLQRQLVIRYLSESLIVVTFAFVLSLGLVQLSLNWFNDLAGKKIHLLFSDPYFWLISFVFILLTGLLAGSYPAWYISSLKPVKILKGVFKAGRMASVPRKILVVTQFTVSIVLIIGTIVVYRQILHAKDRPIGYDLSSLITTYGYPFADHSNFPVRYDYLQNELLRTGAVLKMAKSSSPTTGVYSNQSDFDWEGRDPDVIPNFGVVWCSHDYPETIGLQFREGRNFSREIVSDTAGIILNEAAVEFMGFKEALGKTVNYNRAPFTVIGIVKNVLMESPFAPVRPTVYMINYRNSGIITLKLNPEMSATQALNKIEPVFKSFNPESLFEYQFVDEQFNRKFENEERIGKLATFFAALAIFISCIGLFGLSSFIAEQRTKEIGIRKIFGASVLNLCRMLSNEFVVLVTISCCAAIPIAWYFLNQWLMEYEYRTDLSWWIFAVAIGSALIVSLATVSIQAVKAAMANPVKSLRAE